MMTATAPNTTGTKTINEETSYRKCPTSNSIIEKNKQDPEETKDMTGGLDKEKFDWKEAWYPVYLEEDMYKEKPMAVTVLGMNLVIWWDENASNEEALE